MALAGGGAVAIWHDIAAEGRQAFYAWHGHEHMAERVGIPGFLRGRRYVAVDGTPEYFNLYETEGPDTVAGPDYLARLNAPTPWTVATVTHFRGVARSLCRVDTTAGDGQGGLIATYRYDVPASAAAGHRARVAATLPTLAKEEGIAGAHLLIADEAASSVETAERRARGAGTEVPRWIVLVEGWGDQPAFVATARALRQADLFAEAAGPPDLAVYRLQNALDRRDLRA